MTCTIDIAFPRWMLCAAVSVDFSQSYHLMCEHHADIVMRMAFDSDVPDGLHAHINRKGQFKVYRYNNPSH